VKKYDMMTGINKLLCNVQAKQLQATAEPYVLDASCNNKITKFLVARYFSTASGFLGPCACPVGFFVGHFSGVLAWRLHFGLPLSESYLICCESLSRSPTFLIESDKPSTWNSTKMQME
jgi:hypothetical protein